MELAKRYNEQGADELVFLDIQHLHGRETMIDVIERTQTILFLLRLEAESVELIPSARSSRGSKSRQGFCSTHRQLKIPHFIKESSEIFGTMFAH